jgi:predicted permease
MDGFLLDLRVALRRLLARPWFSLVAVISLGLGIGATTIFFGLMNASLLKPVAADHPEQLVSPSVKRYSAPVVSYPYYVDVRDRSEAFSAVTSYRMVPMAMSLGGGRNSRLWGYLASGNFFSVLGVKAARGRVFTPDDDRVPRGHPVAVLTHLGWQRRFAGAADAVGRAVRVNGLEYRVIGILPPEFNGIERFFAAEMYVPMMMQPQIEPGHGFLDNRDETNLFLLARLRTDIPAAEAERRLNAFAAELGRQYPKTDRDIEFRFSEPGWGGAFLRGGVIGFTGALVGLAMLMLVVVCINLAGLLLARASERRRETAIQLAIGAGKGRLIRALLAESLLLAAAGGSLGLLLAQWGTDWISSLTPPIDFSVNTAISVDYRVVAFSAFITVVTTLAMGLLPALNATRVDVNAALKSDAAARERRWPLRDLIVAGQVALSVLILGAASVVLGSLSHAIDLRPGFNPKGAATAGFSLELHGYDEARGRALERRLLAAVRAEPGVEAAGFTSSLPLDLSVNFNEVSDAALPEPPPAERMQAHSYAASPGYFAAMETRIVAGREFQDFDETGPLAVIVNRTFCRKLFPGVTDPVGRRIRLFGKPHEIAGIVEDGKYLSLSEAPRAALFWPTNRYYSGTVRLVARTRGDANVLVPRLRQLILSQDSDLAVYKAITLEEHMGFPTLPARTAGVALGGFGLLTLFLAAIGIYGVAAFAVARRTREIGIRAAVGASPRQVLTAIFERTAWLLAAGAASGLALSFAARRFLEPLLLSSEGRSDAMLLAGIAAISVVTLLAAWMPARRAMSIAPGRALRHD